jgi:uncharacterized damage-inducible protein DinB
LFISNISTKITEILNYHIFNLKSVEIFYIYFLNNVKQMADILIRTIIQQLRDVENADLWLDENFEKKLSQVSEDKVFTRPIPELHSVAELISHLTVWRRVNIRRMKGETVPMEDDDPENWKTNEQLSKVGWGALLKDFYQSQRDLITMLEGKDDSYLDTTSTHYGKTFNYLMLGMIHHDMYHLGQLGLTVKFLKM